MKTPSQNGPEACENVPAGAPGSCTEHPASLGQTALWNACEISQDRSNLNLLWSLRLRGPLDPAALRQALSRVVARHDALRATFVATADGLRQRIQPAGAVECPELHPGSVTEEALEDLSRQFGLVPFERSAGPLFRFALVPVAARDHLLLCAFHHLVTDGHSWPLFVDELLQHLAGHGVPPLEARYTDYCASERDRLASARGAGDRDFWRGIYADAPAAWDLPADRPRPKVPENASGRLTTVLPGDVADRLRSFAARSGTSPFRTGLAAFFALLHRLTGNGDLLAVTTLIGRSDPRFARLIGFFVNTGGIRVSIQDETTFDRLVAEVHAGVTAAAGHQEYPFDLAVRDAAPRREPGREPFSPVGFTKLPAARKRFAAGLEVHDRRIVLREVAHDVSVYMQQDDGVFRFIWVYRTALFDPTTVARFAACFGELLRRALERPDAPVASLDFVPAAERRRILTDWNGTDRQFPEAPTVHGLVETQAERTPDRVALVSAGLQMTYRELNAAANRLAARLRLRGIGPGHFVPILLDASPELPIAELAILKAGAAFVPLDTGWPRQRLVELLDRLGARVVVTGNASDAAFVGPARERLAIQADEAGPEAANPGVRVGPDDPVYCMFTSGSTGLPKGAVNLHRGIVNRLSAMTAMFGTAFEDSVLATSSPVFDSSVWQYFWPLACGGRCVVFPTTQVADPEVLSGLMGRYDISFTDSVPSIFARLVRHLRAHPEARAGFRKLRRVLIGGEAMAAGPVYEFRQMLPHVALTNTYGPTETSIGVIFQEVPREYTDPVPIGRPIPNVRAVILDRHLNLVPAGLAGELHLGGVCVGQGYLHDPESTARAFVANPFPELACTTLYRTGDLARFRVDGVIEYLGRIDHQVKIRGIRIEPGEIETRLAQHPDVRQAVVLVKEDPPGNKRLVACLAAEAPGRLPDAVGLRAFLEETLPAYMIPSAFVLVDALPLGTSGKVDRKAAARMEGTPLPCERPYEAPRNDLERQIVAIWQELLARTQVGIHDHFFELGGDSVLAIRFVTRLRERTGLPLEVRVLYEAPSPAGLAARLATVAAPMSATPALPEHEPIEQILAKQRPLVSTWRGRQASPASLLFTHNENGTRLGLFWCFQGYRELTQMAAALGADRPLHGMRSGHLIMNYTEQNISALASVYAAEMIALQPDGPFLLGGNCQGGLIARATARLLKEAGRSVALLVLMEESQFRAYDGPVALLFGRDSTLNPYRPGADPEAVFRKSYPGGFTVRFITGAHGQFFEEPHITSLGRTLRHLLSESAA